MPLLSRKWNKQYFTFHLMYTFQSKINILLFEIDVMLVVAMVTTKAAAILNKQLLNK